MIFNMLTSYFSQKFISLFWGSFNEETNLGVKVMRCEDQLLCVCVCVCVCVLLRHLGVFLWVSLAHTYTNLPITTNSLKQPEQQMTDPHTTHNQILPRFRVLDLQTLYCLHMIFKFIQQQQTTTTPWMCCIVWAQWKGNLILSRQSLGTLDAKSLLYLLTTKDQNLVHHKLLLLGTPCIPSPVQTQQWVRHTL